MRKLFFLSLLFGMGINLIHAQEKFEIRNPEVIPGIFHGETAPLKDFKPDPNFPNEITKAEKLGYNPKKNWPLHARVNPNALPIGADPAWQGIYPASGSAKALTRSFDAQTYTSVNPSDPSLDAGPNHVIQMINASSGARFQVFDKAGTSLSGPNQFDAFFGLPGGKGDPIVLYDQLANRWFMSEFSAAGNLFMIAISTTPDPLGTWFTYTFTAPNFPDYPKYSIWPDGYFITTNETTPAIYALDRTQMLAGLPATMQRFTTPNYPTIGFQSTTPVGLEGATPPPAGAPAMFMRMADDAWSAAIPNDRLEIYELDIDFATPANSVFSGPTFLPTAPFDTELNGFLAFSCFAQPGSAIRLDPLREVLMYQIQYRNFGTHESMVCNHVTDVDGTDRGGVRWYELRRTGGGPWSIFQQGTYSPDTDSRWMAAIAINAAGDIGLMYNISSTTTFPGIRATGRRACDPPGQMTEAEMVIATGAAANASNRYGDYNALSVDPADEMTFWGTAQYNPTSQWRTRIASFDITPCCELKIVDVTQTDEICPGANDGTITVSAVTGVGPISYTIAGPVNQTNNTGIFTGLPSGNYSITVTDTGVSGCEGVSSATINPGVDNTPPVLVCPADLTVPCDKINDLLETGMASATDNCDPVPVVTFSDHVVSGDCEWECTVERTWTAVDAFANTSTCVQTIVSSSLTLLEGALSTDVDGDGLADPLVVGYSFGKVTLDAADAACIISWMPAKGDSAMALVVAQVQVGADCLPGANPLDLDGNLINPLFAEGLELGIKVRLDPAFGEGLLSATSCTIAPIVLLFLPPNPTVNDLLRLSNIALGNLIGPTNLQELLAAIRCVNEGYDICDTVKESAKLVKILPVKIQPAPAQGFQVFPNPTTGNVNLDLTHYVGKEVSISVYSLQGQLLQSTTIEEAQPLEQLNLTGNQNGMYLVRVKSEGLPDATRRVVLNGMR
ncbi:MAG: T9SS type A sorting domain-containing protein [Saprospiraceae bacterium]